MYNVTVRRVRATVVVVEKQWVLHKLSVCICSLRYPACYEHVPNCHLWPLYYIFPHFLTNGRIIEKNKSYWTQNVCSDFLYNFCLKHFSFQEQLSEVQSKMYISLHVKYRLFWYDFNGTWIFSTVFLKSTQISNFVKIHPAGAESFHADGRTDMTNLTVAFRNFVGVSKKTHMSYRPNHAYCKETSKINWFLSLTVSNNY